MKPLRVLYCGIQDWEGHPSFILYTILDPIPGHEPLTTLSWNTIAQAGYWPLIIEEDSYNALDC